MKKMLERMFPAEVINGISCITIRGKESVHIEQHKGLVAYQEDEIVFRTSQGLAVIEGEQMSFQIYSAEEAVVSGKIRCIRLAGNGGRR